ncbi:hypothetical protein [Tuwongella immobilis]|uniref:Lipoprotein n=1 Tax=Tuwongella immobilis TaxID=692036 RepID=A0A6C2YLT4_9BACT|nr:hypothetical protein [Tuwongella immobilis]VIP02538.1 Uncharacterized protein OS=Blastopirellula marina DSM 3645 GN=DSM3645_12261 PE=4 SV=1 [Tuwongella immobilis]VTS01703.1 Uncharacterized protein OS=Blastopirellula marina DSM 3645 GN=DSM3645_12261 PE=4 SV=1 [Tuwongella immobilis]
MHRLAIIGLSLVCVVGIGCSDRPRMGKVSGTVTLDGKAIETGTVTFEMTGQRPGTARIENGKIVEAMTYDPGDGIPVGEHRLAVSATKTAAAATSANPGDYKATGANYMGGASLVPKKYLDPTTSGLTATIQSGENVLKLELLSK